MDVVKQDDAAAAGIQPIQGTRRHHRGAVLVVILAVDIDVEHHHVAVQQGRAQIACLGQVREAEEG